MRVVLIERKALLMMVLTFFLVGMLLQSIAPKFHKVEHRMSFCGLTGFPQDSGPQNFLLEVSSPNLSTHISELEIFCERP